MLPAPRIFKTWRFRAIITVAIFSLAVTILPSSASTQPLGESGQVRGGGWVDVALVGLPYESQVSIALTSNSNSLLKIASREDANHAPRIIKSSSQGTVESFPIADSYVNAKQSRKNLGSYPELRVDNKPDMVSFLRFNLPVSLASNGTMGTRPDLNRTYILRVWAKNSHSDGFNVYISNNSWQEASINYSNQPDLISTGSVATTPISTPTTQKPTTTNSQATTTTKAPTTTQSSTTTTTKAPAPPAPTNGGTGLTRYQLHSNIASTIFWVGEIWNANAEDGSQVCSTYDSTWAFRFSGGVNNSSATEEGCAGSPVGGCDGITSGSGSNFTCKRGPIRTAANHFRLPSLVYKDVAGRGISENSFYLDLPYDDLNNPKGFANRCSDIPWANDAGFAGNCKNENFSYMKNRWVQLNYNSTRCYAQVQDAGPSDAKFKDGYYDKNYVFGASQPLQNMYKAPNGSNAGMDVSPATYDCLGLNTSGGTEGTVAGISWRFVDYPEPGPWLDIVTNSGVKN